MTHDEFVAWVESIKMIVPYEVTNCVAHIVFEDFNFRDSDLEFQLKWIDDKSYEPMLSEYQFEIDAAHYVKFLRGAMQLMLTVPEDIRYVYEWEEDG